MSGTIVLQVAKQVGAVAIKELISQIKDDKNDQMLLKDIGSTLRNHINNIDKQLEKLNGQLSSIIKNQEKEQKITPYISLSNQIYNDALTLAETISKKNSSIRKTTENICLELLTPRHNNSSKQKVIKLLNTFAGIKDGGKKDAGKKDLFLSDKEINTGEPMIKIYSKHLKEMNIKYGI